MLAAFTHEQTKFYGDYFGRYNNYLNNFCGNKPVQKIADENLFTEFRNALMDYSPRAVYKSEPFRLFYLKI